MTSNQLTYWKNQEEIRSNKAKEGETRRHNIRQEELTRVQNELEAQGLALKGQEQLIKAAELFEKYGANSYASLPQDAKDKLADIIGTSVHASGGEPKEYVAGLIGDAMKWIFGNKGVSSFF